MTAHRVFLASPKGATEEELTQWRTALHTFAARDGLSVTITGAREYWHAHYKTAGSIPAWVHRVVGERFDVIVVPSKDGRCGIVTGAIAEKTLEAGGRVAWLKPGYVPALVLVTRCHRVAEDFRASHELVPLPSVSP